MLDLIRSSNYVECKTFIETHNLSEIPLLIRHKLLNEALLTQNPKIINLIFEYIMHIFDCSFYSLLEVDFKFLIENKRYSDIHRITLLMSHIFPDYDEDFLKLLTKIRTLPCDDIIATMIDNTIAFLTMKF